MYLVVDCSGSMEGQKISQAREGAVNFAEHALTERYAVGLIRFGSTATHVCEPRQDPSYVHRHLPGLKTDGSTNMANGTALATASLKGEPGPLALVLITDGVPDDQQAALGAAREAKGSGIDVITVGTDDADRSFLSKLASRRDLVVVVADEHLGSGIASTAKMLPDSNVETGKV